jgi:hypothetical protein
VQGLAVLADQQRLVGARPRAQARALVGGEQELPHRPGLDAVDGLEKLLQLRQGPQAGNGPRRLHCTNLPLGGTSAGATTPSRLNRPARRTLPVLSRRS